VKIDSRMVCGYCFYKHGILIRGLEENLFIMLNLMNSSRLRGTSQCYFEVGWFFEVVQSECLEMLITITVVLAGQFFRTGLTSYREGVLTKLARACSDR
jgi:hypothetical protein